MAGYFETFNGDVLKANYVDPVYAAKSVLIPGLTTPADFKINGQTAYYYDRTGLQVTNGPAGRVLELEETGYRRIDVPLTQALKFGGYIPGVAIATVSEDVVGTEAALAANATILEENQLVLSAMVTGGTASKNTTASTKETIYDNIVDDIAEFIETNKHAPVAIIVSPKAKALLQKSDAFVKGNANFEANKAVIGEVAGLAVVDGLGMTGAEYIITDGNGYMHPHSLQKIELFGDIPGRVNTMVLQGEWCYGSQVIKASRLLVKKSA